MAVGIVVGALGAGGGVLTVPILVYLLGQDAHAAAASSLVIVAITALSSLPHHVRLRSIEWQGGLIFGLLTVLGAIFGSLLSAMVAAKVLLGLFSVMLAAVAAFMARRGQLTRRGEQSAAADDELEPEKERPTNLLTVMAVATLTGLLTGFFGVGGGFVVVPLLVFALRLSIRSAVGTSLLVMVVSSLAGFLSRIGSGVEIDWTVTLLFATGSAVGGVLGGPLSSRARPSTLMLTFATLLAVVAVLVAVLTISVN